MTIQKTSDNLFSKMNLDKPVFRWLFEKRAHFRRFYPLAYTLVFVSVLWFAFDRAHEAEVKTATESELLAALVETNSAIISSDKTGVIRAWNKEAEKLFGWKSNEIIGQKISVILPPSMEKYHSDRYVAAFEKESGYHVVNVECQGRTKEDKYIPILVRVYVEKGRRAVALINSVENAKQIPGPVPRSEITNSPRE